MNSCDTLALAANAVKDGQNILAKNSDRPTAEAQTLRFYPSRAGGAGVTVKMTDLEIPDEQPTYAVIGSQPYWTWGFEMGYNEKGVMIGNEAQGSKNATEMETGILGLDLLRLGLERGATARESLDVITTLLEAYGQNANASKLIDRRYENAYLIVDKTEIWHLETAGREWVARRVEDRLGISNCYIIRENFELCSKNVEKVAREHRWLSPDEAFDFSKAYTKPAIRQPLAVPRMRRLNKLLAEKDIHDTESLKKILRDHYEGEIISERFGECNGTFLSICMHMREWGDSETTASIVSREDNILGVVSRFALAQPCLSVYLPIYFTGYLPLKISEGGRYFSENSLWWKFKRLSLAVAMDEAFAPGVYKTLAALEASIEEKAKTAEEKARNLLATGDRDSAMCLLNATMDETTSLAETICDEEFVRLQSVIRKKGGLYGPQKENIEMYCEYAKISIC